MNWEGRMLSRRALLKGAAATSGGLILNRSGFASSPASGASTHVQSYVLPSLSSGVNIIPILTTGEYADNGYRMVGIPDGLGALKDGKTFSVFMHHEIPASSGVTRAHGSKGAFVSKWTIDRNTLRVVEGQDLLSSASKLWQWNTATQRYVAGATKAFDRLCSADLPDEKALRHGNRGTSERLFLGGEEVNNGSAWARIVTGPNAGETWELPRLGKLSWENAVACPHGKDKNRGLPR